MNPPLRFLALIAMACLIGQPPAGAAEPAVPKNRLVLQVSDDDAKKWNAVLNNVHNVQADLGKGRVEVEIVAFGPGLRMLLADSLVANRVEDAQAEGVRFVACRNTMTALKLRDDDMIKGIDYVQAGLVRLMQRQQQGWAYVRP